MKKRFDWDMFIYDLMGAIIIISFIVVAICSVILLVQGFTGQIEPEELKRISENISIYHILGFN